MEKIPETPLVPETCSVAVAASTPITMQENKVSNEFESPTNSNTAQNSPRDVCCKPVTTPDRLKVPKAFKYPERYRSPTDLMMSPVSRGLLARSKKPNGLLPPSKAQAKLQAFQLQEAGLFKC